MPSLFYFTIEYETPLDDWSLTAGIININYEIIGKIQNISNTAEIHDTEFGTTVVKVIVDNKKIAKKQFDMIIDILYDYQIDIVNEIF